MCSICGGYPFDEKALGVFLRAKDRGRDYSNLFYRGDSWICNHRAIPTTEVEHPSVDQPFGTDYKVVHNGVISNDKELGNGPGDVDSKVLATVLDFESLTTLRDSLGKVVGSYAIAVMKPDGSFYLACNYKPIFYAQSDGRLVFSSYEEHLVGFDDVKRVAPYSCLDTDTGESLEIPRRQSERAVVICSGGLDSTAVAAYACVTHGPENVTLINYKYGCIAESKEQGCVRKIADRLGCGVEFLPLDLSFMSGASDILDRENGSDEIASGVEGSEYAHEWVPARNLIMLSTAVGYAEAKGFGHIYLGTNLEEGGAYPDNENQFIKDFDSCLYGAVQNGVKVQVHTPVGNLMKHEIVKFGLKYGAPFELTWSCYRDGDKACGKCGPCFMRRTAFERNGLTDPVQYEE